MLFSFINFSQVDVKLQTSFSFEKQENSSNFCRTVYRSLLPLIRKIAERAVYSGLVQNVLDLNLLPDEQFGFRPNHSTTNQVYKVTEYFSVGLNFKESGEPCFYMSQRLFCHSLAWGAYLQDAQIKPVSPACENNQILSVWQKISC